MFSMVNVQNSLPYLPMEITEVTGTTMSSTNKTLSTITINVTDSNAMYEIRDMKKKSNKKC